FQAEDGIRDLIVTGVQTCALPICFDDDKWSYNEGCLSIPKIREDIIRPKTVTIQYQDEQFQTHTDTFNGITNRVIQHEYDHIERSEERRVGKECRSRK